MDRHRHRLDADTFRNAQDHRQKEGEHQMLGEGHFEGPDQSFGGFPARDGRQQPGKAETVGFDGRGIADFADVEAECFKEVLRCSPAAMSSISPVKA